MERGNHGNHDSKSAGQTAEAAEGESKRARANKERTHPADLVELGRAE